MGKTGPKTLHIPSNNILDVFDAAEQYKEAGSDLIVLAGKDYGCGSSRDWAAKGPFLLGVRAVIAETYFSFCLCSSLIKSNASMSPPIVPFISLCLFRMQDMM